MYIGTQPYSGIRARHTYTATAGQTSFSGAGAENVTLTYSDELYIDVYQNGVKLSPADYTATSGTTVVLAQGASVSDIVEVVKYDAFSVADTVSAKDGGGFGGNISTSGNLAVTGTSAFTGAITSNAGVVVDNITIDGTEIDLSSGDLTLDVAGDISLDADGGNIVIKDGGTHFATLTNSSTDFVMKVVTSDKDIIFQGNDGGSAIEAGRFNMSDRGAFYVGQTNTTILGNGGFAVKPQDANNNVRVDIGADNQAMLLSTEQSTGSIITFYKESTSIGGIGVAGDSRLFITNGDTGLNFAGDSDQILPSNAGTNRDNAIDLGTSNVRFQTLYATTSSINTSDKNEKQDIEELTAVEKKVAIVAKGLLRKYRWKDAVVKKGDKARIHFGIMAQDLQDAFTAESLDASKYSMFCSDTWWEKEITVDAVEEDIEKGLVAKDAFTYMDSKTEATEGYTEKTRLGVRYPELLAFIISAI